MGILDRIKSLVGLGAKPDEKPFICVVLLLRRPAALTEDALHDAAVRAWGREFRLESNECAVIDGPIGIVTFEGFMFHTINSDRPYFDDREKMANELTELRQQKIVREHAAWISVDLLRSENPDKLEKEKCYRRMCSLAAQFADGSCMGVYLTEESILRPNDANLREALTSTDPRKQIREWEKTPVILVDESDTEMKKAVAEARRRWPEFVEAFRTRTKDQPFSVKAAFTDGKNTEWMWMSVTKIEGEMVSGELGNSPVNVRGVREGDQVQVQAKEIGDWVYAKGEKTVGAFSVAALMKSKAK